MTARYTIMVKEHGSDHEVALMECGTNPAALVDGLRKKSLTMRRSIFEPGKRVVKIPKYTSIRVVDHGG
jgi:hypothetical protein